MLVKIEHAWVHVSNINEINVVKERKFEDQSYGPRVVLITKKGSKYYEQFATFEEAEEFAKNLAYKINNMKGEK